MPNHQKPFPFPDLRKYLEEERRLYLTKIDNIEDLLGMERTSEIRKHHRHCMLEDKNTSYSGDGVEESE